jgi:hypothetical protein
VLEHIEEDEVVLRQMFQAIRPGGGIMVTVPQHPFLWSQRDVFGNHKRRYARSELLTKVTQAGFEVIRTTSFVSLLLPLLMMSRSQRQTEENAAFRIKPLTNMLLEKVMDLERAFIQSGASFPVGGSLLLIAKCPITVTSTK